MSRRRKADIEFLLRSWYGKDRGIAENIAWLPKAQRLDTALGGIEKRLLRSRAREVPAVARVWHEIVGAKLAKYTRPVALEGAVLTVEYDRALFLRELLQQKKRYLSYLQQTFGETFCSELRFTATGG